MQINCGLFESLLGLQGTVTHPQVKKGFGKSNSKFYVIPGQDPRQGWVLLHGLDRGRELIGLPPLSSGWPGSFLTIPRESLPSICLSLYKVSLLPCGPPQSHDAGQQAVGFSLPCHRAGSVETHVAGDKPGAGQSRPLDSEATGNYGGDGVS